MESGVLTQEAIDKLSKLRDEIDDIYNQIDELNERRRGLIRLGRGLLYEASVNPDIFPKKDNESQTVADLVYGYFW